MALPCIGDPFSVERPRLLLVEGPDEQHLLIRALREWGFDDVDVRSYGGGDQSHLVDALENSMKATGFGNATCIGVVRDAENDPAAALRTIKGALHQASLPVPADGEQFAEALGPMPRVGALVIPDGVSPGCLEGLCLDTVEEDAALECVRDYHECLLRRAVPLHPRTEKVRLYAFLASRRKPGLRIGQAWDAGVWGKQHQAWQPLRDFIASM